MKGETFVTGDKVAVSATFLRSICPNAAAGWPTTFDPGKGIVIMSFECAGVTFVDVWFNDHWRRFNSLALVHERDIYMEAMRAEHKAWRYR